MLKSLCVKDPKLIARMQSPITLDLILCVRHTVITIIKEVYKMSVQQRHAYIYYSLAMQSLANAEEK